MHGNFSDRVMELLQLGLLGAFGGLANYVYVTMQNETKFSWIRLFVNVFLAFFVGNMIGSLLPDSTYKDGVLMAAGFCTYPILNIIEVQSRKRLGQLLDRWLSRQVGPEADKDSPEA